MLKYKLNATPLELKDIANQYSLNLTVLKLEESKMNPETNRFEKLTSEMENQQSQMADLLCKLQEQNGGSGLLRPDGSPVPKTWTVFSLGELVEIKGYTFKVAYIGETSILFEPIGIPILEPK
jgi:hypothetical protein